MLGINQEDEVTSKCTEEMESLPNMQMPAFPFLDLNGVSDIVQWIVFLLLFCPKSYANSTVVYVLLYDAIVCMVFFARKWWWMRTAMRIPKNSWSSHRCPLLISLRDLLRRWMLNICPMISYILSVLYYKIVASFHTLSWIID